MSTEATRILDNVAYQKIMVAVRRLAQIMHAETTYIEARCVIRGLDMSDKLLLRRVRDRVYDEFGKLALSTIIEVNIEPRGSDCVISLTPSI